MKPILFILLISFVYSCSTPNNYSELKEENQKLKIEIVNLNKKIKGLDKQNTEYLAQLEELTKKLNDVE